MAAAADDSAARDGSAAPEDTAASDDTVTTGQMTHRYLRLTLVLAVFALLTSVLIETVVLSWQPLTFGWRLLPSISHYFYTPARDVFVATLIAASLALLALSGRGRATTLLDIAAVFAPLIAIVPTGIASGMRIDGAECPDSLECVPREYLDGVRLGVAIYAIVVIVVVVVLAIIRARRRSPARSALLVSLIAAIAAVVISALAFVPPLNEGFPFNFWPVNSIHFVATLLFFGAFAAVPILHARGASEPGETPPTARQRTIYRWISGLLIADLALLVAAVAFRQVFGEASPFVLIGEAVALCLFAWFWWMQTFQRWDDPNPPGIIA
nr:hypothetical protein [uncultured Microbacterium sp.]